MKTLKIGDVVLIEHKINKKLNHNIGIVMKTYYDKDIIVIESVWRFGYWYCNPSSLTKIGTL